jgi:Uma2 family endonuclease
MSTATTREHQPPVSANVPYEFTTDAFLRMIEAGDFPEEARVYLEDGRIYEKMAKTNAHGMLAAAFAMTLTRKLPVGWSVIPEAQIRLDAKNSPLPDVMVIRGSDPRSYVAEGRYPDARDIGLVVEIAVTSLAKDLGSNLERFARNKVPNYWVADIPGKRILAHSKPRVVKGLGTYTQVDIIQRGGILNLVLDGRDVTHFACEDLML